MVIAPSRSAAIPSDLGKFNVVAPSDRPLPNGAARHALWRDRVNEIDVRDEEQPTGHQRQRERILRGNTV